MACSLISTPHPNLPPIRRNQSLGGSIGHLAFTSSFVKDAMLKYVWYVEFLLIMGDVKVAFKILTHYFMQWPSYFLWCTPPSSTFIQSFVFFYSFFLQMFRCLLSPWSFDSPEGPLAYKKIFLPITFGGIGFIHRPNNLIKELNPCSFNHSCWVYGWSTPLPSWNFSTSW